MNVLLFNIVLMNHNKHVVMINLHFQMDNTLIKDDHDNDLVMVLMKVISVMHNIIILLFNSAIRIHLIRICMSKF